VLYR
jgi:uncharacterized protein with WD repeat